MRLLVLVLMAPLSALASNVLVVPSDAARALGLGDAVVDVLSNLGVALKVAGPKAPAAACTRVPSPTERRACLVEIANGANVATVLLLTATEQRKIVTANVELISQTDGKVLSTLTIKAPQARWAKQAAVQLKPLKHVIAVHHFTPADEPRPPEPVADTTPKKEPAATQPKVDPPAVAPAHRPETDRPTAVSLTPEPTTGNPEVTAVAGRPSHVAAWTATGVTVAAAAVSGTFTIIGLSNKGRVESAPDGLATLPHKEAVALQGQANSQLTVGLISGLAAVVTGAVAATLWGLDL